MKRSPTDIYEANRRSWNAATPAHNSHKLDQAEFLAGGGSTLFPEEVELLGDLTGARVAHLLCNSGQDTLSLVHLGAEVVGVDISDEAVDFARRLSAESGIPGTFIRSEVYAWLEREAPALPAFDVVFCSYGALVWLADLVRWARGIRSILKPSGRFVAVEFHPLAMTLGEDWSFEHPYFAVEEPIETAGVPDYVAESGKALCPSGYAAGTREFVNPHPDYTFSWSLGDVLTPFLRTGMVLERFEEYPYANGAALIEGMRQERGRRWFPPPELPSLPMMFAVSFRVPAGPLAADKRSSPRAGRRRPAGGGPGRSPTAAAARGRRGAAR